MNCPHCGAWSTVYETREAPLLMLRRGRLCANGHKFKTYEMHAAAMCSAKQRATAFAATVKARIALWQRNTEMRKLHKAGTHWSELARKYKLNKSGVFAALKSGK